MAPKKGEKKLAKPMAQALRSTLHPPGTTCLQVALDSTDVDCYEPESTAALDVGCLERNAAIRALVLQILNGPCQKPIRPGHSSMIIMAKGRVNANSHGAWVFTYDQRIPDSAWDGCTVLCRGLLVIFSKTALLAEGFPQEQLAPGTRLDSDDNALLHKLCTSSAGHACRIFEPMPKFWEAGDCGGEVSWEDILAACGGAVPQLSRVEEKIDGNLGLLYPQLDDELHPISNAEPLLATKGTAHSKDIERQMQMLHRLYPCIKLHDGVSHAIVEIIDREMKVCVPYKESDMGARLIVASTGSAWMAQDMIDSLAAKWCMARPLARPIPQNATLTSIQELASKYQLAATEMLEEGFVVHLQCPPLADVIRIKVHTHVWNVVHGWWEDNPRSKTQVSIRTVMPVLRDPRFSLTGVSAIEACLVKYRKSNDAVVEERSLVCRFRQALERARACLDECTEVLITLLDRTSTIPRGKELVRVLDNLPDELAHLSKSQAHVLKECIQCLRAKIEQPLTGAMAESLPRSIRRALSSPEAADENSTTVESELEQELMATLCSHPCSGIMDRMIRDWADHAQAQFEREEQEDAKSFVEDISAQSKGYPNGSV